MTTATETKAMQRMWATWLSALAGIWVLVAPFAIPAFAEKATARTSDLIAGLVVLVLALVAFFGHGNMAVGTSRTLGWAMAVVGIFILASPWIWGTAALAAILWEDVILGIIVGFLGLAYAWQ